MVIKSTSSEYQARSEQRVQNPLCNGHLPTSQFCEAGDIPPLDEYMEYTDWVPFFYAPPQYNFCRAFDEWYYKSCVPAAQEARNDIRDIAQTNGSAGSKKEIDDKINGTLTKTEDACAGIDPGILKEIADNCGTINDIHNKNRIILGLGAFVLVKGLFTLLAVRHASRSRNEMRAAGERLWGELKAAHAKLGMRAAAGRLWTGLGEVWNAREGHFRERVTDLNIFFARLLEYFETEHRSEAIARWNEVEKQGGLSTEEKFERFKGLIRQEFSVRILDIIDEIETSLIKELILQAGRFERLAAALESGENIDAQILISEISAPIERLYGTLSLFQDNIALFHDSEEVRRYLLAPMDFFGNLLQDLTTIYNTINKGETLSGNETVRNGLLIYDLRRLDLIVGLAASSAAEREGIDVTDMGIAAARLQSPEEILAVYDLVKLIIKAFAYDRTGEGEVDISADVKDGVVEVKAAGQKLPDYRIWSEAREKAQRLGWRIGIGDDLQEVVLEIGTRPDRGIDRIKMAVQGLYYFASHFKLNDIAEVIKGEAAIFSNDMIPLVERLYSRFEAEFYETILPQVGDYMGQIVDLSRTEGKGPKVSYVNVQISTLLGYAGFLSDSLHDFAVLTHFQLRHVPQSLTPEWQTASRRFWGLIHDIGNVRSVLGLSVGVAIDDGDLKYTKKFDLTHLGGLFDTVEAVNYERAETAHVKIVTDNEVPEIAIPRPSHVAAFRIVNELVTNAVKYADPKKAERNVMIIYEIEGARTEVIDDAGHVTATDDRKLFIVVADNGVGIRDITAAKAGTRLSPGLAEGTGTGLASIAELAAKEGWQFDISSDFSTLAIPEALRAHIKGMSTAAVLTIDLSKWERAAAPLGGYEADRKAAPLSAGARAALAASSAASGVTTGVNVQAPSNAATGIAVPARLPVVP